MCLDGKEGTSRDLTMTFDGMEWDETLQDESGRKQL